MKTRSCKTIFGSLLVLIVMTSCTQVESRKAKIKVLILGNSIVHHGSSPSIGWYGEWGMAASAIENDFVHILIRNLRDYKHSQISLWFHSEWPEQPYKNLDYRILNIAYWEQNFSYDFSAEPLLDYKPDILIVRLGENVNEEYAKKNNYEANLIKLIDSFKSKSSKVIVTGNFWPSSYKDEIQEKVATNNGYKFIDMTDLAIDERNKAIGKFENGGVAAHPSDFGMKNISEKIFKQIIEDGLFYN